MYKKSLIIFITTSIFLAITLFLMFGLKIDYYEKALITAQDGQSQMIINQKTYHRLLREKFVTFKSATENYHQEIRHLGVMNNQYFCIIDYLQEFENHLQDINVQIKQQTIFGF